MPHVVLRIWGKPVPAELEEAKPVSEPQRRHAEAMSAPQCGAAAGNPFVPWFGEAAEHVRSLAFVPLAPALGPLGQSAVFGALAMGSEDPQRFCPEMGTLYLRRIGELCAAAVTARL